MIYHYQTISSGSEGTYQESGSKFLGYLVPVESRGDIEHCLQELKELHPKARHHCYAYRIIDGHEVTEFSSDAGEPSGSAGLPILNELRRQTLTNICAIVVRYFGGTKLGIPGLIHAYRAATQDAIEAGSIIERERMVQFQAEMPISLQPHFYKVCKQLNIDIAEPQYAQYFSAQITLPLESQEARINQMLSRLSGLDGESTVLTERIGLKLTHVTADQAT